MGVLPRLLRLSIVRTLAKVVVQVKIAIRGVEPSPSNLSSKEKDKTLHTVVKSKSSSHQTHDYLPGSTTFYLSLLDGFSKSTKDPRNATRDSSSQSWTTLRKLSNGHKCQQCPYNPTLWPLCHEQWNRVLRIRA
jgi:hypothetical protein